MTGQRKRVSLHLDSSMRHEAGGRTSLPAEVLEETAQRLALFCAIGAGTWTIAVVMANVLRPASVPTPFPWPGSYIGSGMPLLLTASFLYVRSRPLDEPPLDFGLGLLIINAFAIALINEWVPTFPDTRFVSWNAILILVYAMVLPTTPLNMFVACLV